MGMGIAGLMTGGGAGKGLEALLRQRLMERQMALQEQSQAQDVDYRNRALAESSRRTDVDDARQRSMDKEMSDYRDLQGTLGAARETPYGMPLEPATAMKFKASALPVAGPSQGELNSPLANEEVTPYQYAGNQPPPERPATSKLLTPEEYQQRLRMSEEEAKIAAKYRAPAGGGGGNELSEAGLELAADWIGQGLGVPALGMGSGGRVAAFNRAGEKYPGMNPAAATGGYKSNLASLTQLTKRVGAIKPYSAQASLSLDNVLKASASVPRSGVPLANRYKNWINKNLTGLAPLSAFEVYVYNAARDYARVSSGGSESIAQLTDTASEAAEALLNTAQTPDQLAEVVAAMKADMANTTSTLEQQLAETRTTIGRKPGEQAPATSGAPPQNPQPGATWQSPTGPTVWDGKMWKPR